MIIIPNEHLRFFTVNFFTIYFSFHEKYIFILIYNKKMRENNSCYIYKVEIYILLKNGYEYIKTIMFFVIFILYQSYF